MNRIIALISICILALPLSAGSSNVGTDAFVFMRLGLDARGMGLGGARVADVDDIAGVVWNPAGLNGIKAHQVSFSNSQIFNNQSANFFSYGGRIIGPGVLGLSLAYVDLGSFEQTQVNLGSGAVVRNLGTADGNDVMGIISYAWQIGKLEVGASLKIAREKLADESATAFAADAGIKFDFYDGWLWGAAVQNLGPSVKFIQEKDDLPLVLRTGVSKRWYFGAARNGRDHSLQTEIDVVKPSGNNFGVNAGVEYKPIEYFALRLGYDSLQDAGSGLTAGFGAYMEGFELSYAFIDADKLSDQHRITLAYTWGDRISAWWPAKTAKSEAPVELTSSPQEIALENTIQVLRREKNELAVKADALSQGNEQLRQQVEVMSQENSAHQIKAKKAADDNRELNETLASLNADIIELRKSLSAADEKISGLNRDLETMKREAKNVSAPVRVVTAPPIAPQPETDDQDLSATIRKMNELLLRLKQVRENR